MKSKKRGEKETNKNKRGTNEVSRPARMHLPARNGLVNKVEFLGLILQKW